MEVDDNLLRFLFEEMNAWAFTVRGSPEDELATERVIRAAEALPRPPKLDAISECAEAYAGFPSVEYGAVSEKRLRAALLRYRELGCPEID